MRKFLLPLLFASILAVGYVATGHVPHYPLDQLAIALAGISTVAAIPLYIIGHKLDGIAFQQRAKRRIEKAAVREMEHQAREREARADAEELRKEQYRNGNFDYEDKPSGNGKSTGYGFVGFGG
jgi:hypothetical protein